MVNFHRHQPLSGVAIVKANCNARDVLNARAHVDIERKDSPGARLKLSQQTFRYEMTHGQTYIFFTSVNIKAIFQ